jgi:hypothetical protein
MALKQASMSAAKQRKSREAHDNLREDYSLED